MPCRLPDSSFGCWLVGVAALMLVCAESVARTIGSDRTSRLVVVNGCSSKPLWIAHIIVDQIGPDPQDVKLVPGESARFHTSIGSDGLAAARYWAKMGCDEAGHHCSIGDSGGPGEGCVIRAAGKDDDYSNCSPPVDSKFEATFAPLDGPAGDTVDMSLVDGYSMPFKLEVTGGSCIRNSQPFQGMDCSELTLNQCPTAERLNGKTVDLQARNPITGKIAGCYSPCTKLTDDKWSHGPVAPGSLEAGPYCCQGNYASPNLCKAAAIMQTQYLKEMKRSCPAAYGYAFDDSTATIVCTTSTEYTVTFYCPHDLDEEFEVLFQ